MAGARDPVRRLEGTDRRGRVRDRAGGAPVDRERLAEHLRGEVERPAIHVAHERAHRLRGQRRDPGETGDRAAGGRRVANRDAEVAERVRQGGRRASLRIVDMDTGRSDVAVERQRGRQRDVVGGEVFLPSRGEPIVVERSGDPDHPSADVAHAGHPDQMRQMRDPGLADLRVALPAQEQVALDGSARIDAEGHRSELEGPCGAELVEKGHREQELLVGRRGPARDPARAGTRPRRRCRPSPTSGARPRSRSASTPTEEWRPGPTQHL